MANDAIKNAIDNAKEQLDSDNLNRQFADLLEESKAAAINEQFAVVVRFDKYEHKYYVGLLEMKDGAYKPIAALGRSNGRKWDLFASLGRGARDIRLYFIDRAAKLNSEAEHLRKRLEAIDAELTGMTDAMQK